MLHGLAGGATHVSSGKYQFPLGKLPFFFGCHLDGVSSFDQRKMNRYESSYRAENHSLVSYSYQYPDNGLYLWPGKRYSPSSLCSQMGYFSIDCFVRALVMERVPGKKSIEEKKIFWYPRQVAMKIGKTLLFPMENHFYLISFVAMQIPCIFLVHLRHSLFYPPTAR